MWAKGKWAAIMVCAGCTSTPGAMDAGPGLSDLSWIAPDFPDPARDPHLQVVVTDALRGGGIPCKLTVNGLGDTPTPSWGSDPQRGEWLDEASGALGAGRWVLLARGYGSIALSPGRYRVTATRGPEFEALSWDVEVTQTRGARVTGALRRVVESDGDLAGEFHVHAIPSFDSLVALDQRVLSLAVEGIEVFASTDHDVAVDYMPTIRRLGLERHIRWINGVEITTEGHGHFNVYTLPMSVDPSSRLDHRGRTVAEIFARVRSAAPDAVMQLNHPLWSGSIGYWRIKGYDPVTGHAGVQLVAGLDAIEVWNGHTLDDSATAGAPVDDVIDAWMSTLQMGRGATAMGNSDSHRVTQSPPGWPRSNVHVGVDDPMMATDAMVVRAIKSGDVSLGSGPYLRMTVNGARPGGMARATGRRVTVQISVQAPAWVPVDAVEVVANRRVVATREVTVRVGEMVRQEWSVELELTRDAWVLARTRAAAPLSDLAGAHGRPMPSLALVNPVYVDVDGDGRWTPPGIDGGP